MDLTVIDEPLSKGSDEGAARRRHFLNAQVPGVLAVADFYQPDFERIYEFHPQIEMKCKAGEQEIQDNVRPCVEGIMKHATAKGKQAKAEELTRPLLAALGSTGDQRVLRDICDRAIGIYTQDGAIGSVYSELNARFRKIRQIPRRRYDSVVEESKQACGDLWPFAYLAWTGLGQLFPVAANWGAKTPEIYRGLSLPQAVLEEYKHLTAGWQLDCAVRLQQLLDGSG
jgi:hypothetical protein